MNKPTILLEVDWEQTLREMHKRPKYIKPGTSDADRWTSFTKTLNSRIKEVRAMVARGEAAYK